VIGLVVTLALSMAFVGTILFTPTRKIALGIFAIGTGLLGINICALFFFEYKKV